jgi:hypothetical protein
MGVERDDASRAADAAQDVPHRVDADLVVPARDHLGLDAADDVASCRSTTCRDEVAQEAARPVHESGPFENTISMVSVRSRSRSQ